MTLGEFRAKTKAADDSVEIIGACGEFVYDVTNYDGRVVLDLSDNDDDDGDDIDDDYVEMEDCDQEEDEEDE